MTLEIVRKLDPVGGTDLGTPGIDDAVERLAHAVVRAPAARRVPRLSLVFAAGLVAAIVGVGIAAAAGAFHARTGLFPSPRDVAIGGPGEELNPAAPDFRSVALQLSSDIPYPDGYASWRDRVITLELRTADGGLESTGALRGWFAMSAFCAWVDDWRQATTSGDNSEAATAAQNIAAAPSWKAVTAEDPHPNPNAVNDPGAETGTLFGWFLPYRDAVLSGDTGRVDHLLATGYGDGKCWLADPQSPQR